MPDVINLSTGEKVTFKPYFTHKADKAFKKEYQKDVVYERGDDGLLRTQKLPVNNYQNALESTLLIMIESIEGVDGEMEINQGWLDNLKKSDYETLEKGLEAVMEDKKEGEKKSGATKA